MTLTFFSYAKREHIDKERYYISQLDGDTYQIVDSTQSREICVCSNYDDWEDAEERARNLVKLLNENSTNLKK